MRTVIGKSQNVAPILDQTSKSAIRLHVDERVSYLRSADLQTMMLEKRGQIAGPPLRATLDSATLANGRGKTVATAALSTRSFTAYHIGNSLTEDLFYDFRAVATRHEAKQGNTYSWGFHFRPGTSLTFMYNNPTPSSTPYPTISGVGETDTSIWPSTNLVPWPISLPANHWDVVTMEPYPGDDTNGPATLGSDTVAINAMIALTKTRADNASTRFFIYEAWPPVTYGDLKSYSTAWLAPTQHYPGVATSLNRNYFTDLVSAVRQINPDVEVIPVGEVLYTLDVKMRAGQFQNFNAIRQLHRDAVHLNSVGQNVVAWTAYATIFKESPVGLRNDVLDNATVSPFTNVTAISPADMLLMQQTVWDVVRNLFQPQPSPDFAHR